MPSLTLTNHEPEPMPHSIHKAPSAEPVIFVVEDDSRIRGFICNVLRYATTAFVIEASDPYDALFMASEIGRPIQLLISDINLSAAINGVDLAHEISARNPAMRVLLISAGSLPDSAIPPGWRFLPKPFSIAAFLGCVHELCLSVWPPKTTAKRARKQSAA